MVQLCRTYVRTYAYGRRSRGVRVAAPLKLEIQVLHYLNWDPDKCDKIGVWGPMTFRIYRGLVINMSMSTFSIGI